MSFRVTICAVGDGGEAIALRTLLESQGATVLMHWIGRPKDLLSLLGDASDRDAHLILSGHGDARGFVFGSFGEGVDISELDQGSLPASKFKASYGGRHRTVISTACLTGGREWSDAFAQADFYIAPEDHPDGAAVPLFVLSFFHGLTAVDLDIPSAARRANGLLPPDDRFHCFPASRP